MSQSVEEPLRRRVLVVDDEPAMRLLCRVNLPLSGFDVVEAADGETALGLLQAERFDVVLLDVMLPGLTGFAIAERLEGAGPPIVFLSARADRTDVRRGLELGAAAYVTKPFDPIAIGDLLQEVLGDGVEAVRARRLRELDG
jgi:DNA-binding response OmpR family regulator